eukprot:1151810-Pelagomonas_calceolata.AAC.4
MATFAIQDVLLNPNKVRCGEKGLDLWVRGWLSGMLVGVHALSKSPHGQGIDLRPVNLDL